MPLFSFFSKFWFCLLFKKREYEKRIKIKKRKQKNYYFYVLLNKNKMKIERGNKFKK